MDEATLHKRSLCNEALPLPRHAKTRRDTLRRMKVDSRTGVFVTTTAIMLTVIAFHASAQQKKPSGPPRETVLDKEAKAFAQRLWEKVWRRCPDPPRADSYFTYSLSDSLHFIGDKLYYKTSGYGHDADELVGGYCCQSMTEAKGVSFQTQGAPLSEPDKLNGITWAGSSLMKVQAYRQREQQSGGWGPWGEWKSGTMYGADTVIGFRKINGMWERDLGRPGSEVLAGMPGCSDLEGPFSEQLWHRR